MKVTIDEKVKVKCCLIFDNTSNPVVLRAGAKETEFDRQLYEAYAKKLYPSSFREYTFEYSADQLKIMMDTHKVSDARVKCYKCKKEVHIKRLTRSDTPPYKVGAISFVLTEPAPQF